MCVSSSANAASTARLRLGEVSRRCGFENFGRLGKKHTHVVEDVLRALHELRALLDELVRAEGDGIVDAAGNRVNRAPLIRGLIRRDERAAVSPASTTSNPNEQPATIRFRIGNVCLSGGVSIWNSETTAPFPAAMRSASSLLRDG